MKNQWRVWVTIATAYTMTDCATQDIECDFVADGFCVVTNGYPTRPEMVSYEIGLVQEKFNQFYDTRENPLVLGLLGEEHDIVINFVPREEVPENARGFCYRNENRIDVNWVDDIPSAQCQESYYVLGHELLHVIAFKYMGGLSGHDIHPLFFADEGDSVERQVWIDTAKTCEFMNWSW